MLETIREFGLERLAESGEEPQTRRRHAAFFLQLVDQLDAFWAPFMPNAQQILDRLEVEYPNLHAALAWCREVGDVATLLELAGALYFFWQLRGHIREGREWLEWGLRRECRCAIHGAGSRADRARRHSVASKASLRARCSCATKASGVPRDR